MSSHRPPITPPSQAPLPGWWHRRRWLALACLAITLAALPLLRDLSVDNSLEIWLDSDGAVYHQYQEFLDRFGSEEYILVIYPLPAAPSLDFFERLTDLRLHLEEVEGIRYVLDIAGLFSRVGTFQDLQSFDHDLRAAPLYRNFLVSGDASKAATWITLDVGQNRRRVALVHAVEEAVRDTLPGVPVHFAGSPVVNAALDDATRTASKLFFPLVFVLSALVLAVLYRHPMEVLIPFLSVGAGIAWTLAVVVLSGRTLNMVTVALPSLVWVLGLSTSIHLLSLSRRKYRDGQTAAESITGALHELAGPCSFSALTTAIGFISLAVSSMQPVREMGIFAALGILLCLVSNFVFFPVLAEQWLGRQPRRNAASSLAARLSVLLRHLADRTLRRRRTVLALSLLIALVSLAGLARLRADSNVVGFFKDDSPIAVTYHQVLRGFTGHQSLEVVLRPPADAISPQVFASVEALGRRIDKEPGVIKVLSAVDLVKSMYRQILAAPPETDILPTTEPDFEDAWEMAGRLLPEERRSLVSADEKTLRLSALVSPLGSRDHRRMVDAVRRDIAELIDPTWETGTTGIVQLLLDMQHRLLTSQIRSFAVAFLLIGPTLALLLRSWRFGLLCLLVNLLPIVVTLGFMGFSGIPLDPATVMIAGIALGIAVDDSIHFLTRYRFQRRRGEAESPAIRTAFDSVGPPMLTTSVVSSLGFFVLCFSSFRPLFYFGLLSGLTMIVALASSLILLPSLLVRFTR